MASLTMVSETSGSSSYSLERRRHRPSQPSVRSCHPAAREEDEALASGEAPDDDQGQAEQEAGEQGREPVVHTVGEHNLEPRVEPLQPLEEVAGAIGILNIGGVDGDAEQQARGVGRDVALPALDLLGRIPAARPPCMGRSLSRRIGRGCACARCSEDWAAASGGRGPPNLPRKWLSARVPPPRLPSAAAGRRSRGG